MINVKNSFLLFFVLTALTIKDVHALVDYSENTMSNEAQINTNKFSTKLPLAKNDSKSLIWKSDFSFTTNYEALELDNQKISQVNLNTHLQTPANVFFDISYWNAQTSKGAQNGNPRAIIGFNWLRLGSSTDEARFDIFGGAKIASKSIMASSRNDKIFGFETTKRFGSFGLGIGYEIALTGLPSNENDFNIGNIHKLAISSGWMVSNDIQFEMELENYKVQEGSGDSLVNRLNQSLSFSTISPKLILTIVPAINLELGARFRTNKPKSSQDLKSAKIFDLHGAYSNSLFAGLNLNL